MIGLIFLDLRRAFELVDRNILLKKFEWYRIKENIQKEETVKYDSQNKSNRKLVIAYGVFVDGRTWM